MNIRTEMMKKKRILYIATFPPPVHGSAVVSMQIKNSEVINQEFDGDYVNLSTSRNMDEIGKKGTYQKLLKFSRFLKSYLRTLRLLLTHHYDLCYCAITINTACFLRDAPYVLLCKFFGHKVVIHQHNVGMSKLIDKPIYSKLYPLVYKNTKVILLSWHLYSDIERVVDKEHILICPNGIKPQLSECLERVTSRDKVSHIFSLSNLLITKGILVLLDALQILKDRGNSFVCDFVGGESKDIDSIRFENEVTKRGLAGMAIYHGRKYGNDKDLFWRKANIFVLPSFGEAFPLVNLEAMDYGLPIVASNVGGIPDEVVINKNGLLVPPQNPTALADALESVLKHPEVRNQMGKESRRMFEEKFTEVQFERTMLDCLKKSML